MHLDTFDRQAYGIGSKKSLVHTNKIPYPPRRKFSWPQLPCSLSSVLASSGHRSERLASSAYYAGGEAEQFIGKTAPWFILATMLLSYAFPSYTWKAAACSVRGGVYRVVKEAMGGHWPNFPFPRSCLTTFLPEPISGVSAAGILLGLLTRVFAFAHLKEF